ncbi:MAG: nuclear transport factor 2 family protein [Silicimonas sp.]|nr:nuclear transport factor 2 family protein [Silicimonas sp.]MBT8424805.1 nuclear transport factor 2 family protein [Silicimonas sp.]NND18759.1 nuclear transport factor 2 family protein [Silicimonas sp.]NNL72967.1 nuclear transport factor 2 family protein [Silicimonas sp.]RZW00012.1 MAG: nuclear transport factor 2 family protein [Paracoccaceae bacterium]
MSTQDIAQKLVQHCQNHTEAQGLQELYAEDAVSIEPMAPEGMDPISNGREAIKAKHEWWNSNFDVHGMNVEGPFVNGSNFSVMFEIDATDKSSGDRWKSKEVALYETDGEKIVRESFFMAPMK